MADLLPEKASIAIIAVTYPVFLIFGTLVAWKMKKSKGDLLAGNGTQKALPLAFNFIAAILGSSMLFAYPELGLIAGVQGVLIYALSSALPLFAFAILGPMIRKRCPEGFVLTEWTRQRYGVPAALFLSFMTLVTLFLYMIAELSAVGQVVQALTGLDPLPVMITQAAVTTIYTSLGGFKVSFLTDIVQGAMVIGLIIIATIAIGVTTDIDTSLIPTSGLLEPTTLGWQLLYILPVCIITNDLFLSHLWLRTFASKTDRDLWTGITIAVVISLIIFTLVGMTGPIAAWSGAYPGDSPEDATPSISFFLLLGQLPRWVVGIVLVMVITTSTAAFDSIQSAMVSSASNDLFRNKLNAWYIRGAVVLLIAPVIVLALKAPSILQIYLISDLVSAAVVPVLVLGLADEYFFWWRGFEVVVGGLGGIFTVFLFGTVYYGDAHEGARLILIEKGLTSGDWAVFGAFVAAPVGGMLWAFAAAGLRLAVRWVVCQRRGVRFDGLDRPDAGVATERASIVSGYSGTVGSDEVVTSTKVGKFF